MKSLTEAVADRVARNKSKGSLMPSILDARDRRWVERRVGRCPSRDEWLAAKVQWFGGAS